MGIVRHTIDALPPVCKEDLDRVDAIRDEDIDYSDIPEVTDFSKFRPCGDLRSSSSPTLNEVISSEKTLTRKH